MPSAIGENGEVKTSVSARAGAEGSTSRKNSSRTVGIHTLGCRLNQFESDGIVSRFLDDGQKYELVPLDRGPDIAIINTCTVTDQADSRSRALVRKILRANPLSRIVFTGCYAQTDPEKVAAIPGVFAVVGNDGKTRIKDILEGLEERQSATKPEAAEELNGIQTASSRGAAIFSSGALDRKKGDKKRPVLSDPFAYGDVFPVGHSRAYLKIQDGCDRKCSYCKIPRARGGGVSRSFFEILDHVRSLDDRRIPEIVITGVNPGWYSDSGRRFNDLIRAMLSEIKYSRIRLSSIEPCDVDEELAELSLHPRFCNYFHVPLQSGSRDILRLMRRTYSAESYRKRMETVRRVNPRAFLGTDVIAGFPGESEEHFQETLELLQDLGIIQVHAFPYSPREGTDALDLPDPVDRGLAKERVKRLQDFSARQWQTFLGGLAGESRVAVIEKWPAGSDMPATALSDDYVRMEFDTPALSDFAGNASAELSAKVHALSNTKEGSGADSARGRLAEFVLGQPSGPRSVRATPVRLLPL
ncbi:MAG: tRNA (N(6)-L-threonylcarbamoyladenosine(37)-C(2))-methylthiotransferase MtaB [Leptospiraceae bacterium]|nr:tRNA (N(6)-L-threonylcarbamoyladenosine(37)-C(2))-methylthiotransferase MtaB [Leptospiraceae bacterium]